MTTPPTVQTPPYKPSKPPTSILPDLETPYETPCHFTLPTFLHVLKDLTLHPERNSSLILRADPIPLDTQSQVKSTELEEDEDEDFENWVRENGMERVEDIRVRLMPKQPKRDGKLDQRVLFYRSKEVMGHDHDLVGERAVERGVVVMIPLVKRVEDIPFFHPPVRKLVFHYESQAVGMQPTEEDQMVDGMKSLSTNQEGDDTAGPAMETPEIQGRISISYLLFPPSQPTTPSSDPTSTSTIPGLAVRRTSMPRKRSPLAGPSSETSQPEQATKEDTKVTEARLDRTCLALLERVYKHGFGSMVGYKKRVNHDVRNTFTKVDRPS
jgi:tRNASer (uridine44-2'-O)-methyltransferase